MKTTSINFPVTVVILLLPVLWTDASGVVKIEAGRTGRISGYIRNAASNQPLECAAVTLFSASDSSMVAGTISNSDGSFIISMLTPGNYFLEISEQGYEKKYISGLKIQPVHSAFDTGEIRLFPEADKRKRTKY